RPERSKPQQFVRDKRWKLYRNGTFFDVANDVKEKNDLSGSETPDAAAARAKLQTALDSFPAKGQQLLNFVPNDR
ncbi:MAG: hypothetical protein ACI92S_004660, partial [Planctomycetaceae bacterium]